MKNATIKVEKNTITITKKYVYVILDGKKIRACRRVKFTAHEQDTLSDVTTIQARLRDVHGKWKTVRGIPAATALNGKKLLELLLNRGLETFDNKLAAFALENIYAIQKPSKSISVVATCGWYSVGSKKKKLVFVDGNSEVRIDAAHSILPRVGMCSEFAQQGTLEEWNTHIGEYCRGNDELQLLMFAALAGPALRHLGQSNFGFQLVGPTKHGKSIGTQVVASIYGAPNYCRGWAATPNALTALAFARNDCALLLDEIGEADAHTVALAIYQLGNGRGKARLGSDRMLEKPADFRGVLIANGEVSLSDLLQQGGKNVMAGQEARLIPIAIDATLGVFRDIHRADSSGKFVRALANSCKVKYGTLGASWIRLLSDDQEDVVAKLSKSVERSRQRLIDSCDIWESVGVEDSILQSMAVCAAVGEFAIRRKLLKWERGEALAAVARCFGRWKTAHIANAIEPVDNVLQSIRRFFEANTVGRFPSLATSSGKRPLDLAGYTHTLKGVKVFLMLPDVFQREFCKRAPLNAVLTNLRKKDFLVVGSKGRTKKQIRLPGVDGKKVNFYVIKQTIVDS